MASKAIQRQGLDGKFVIDSRGLAAKKGDGSPDAYGVYDQRLRDLADMVRRHTSPEPRQR